MLSSLRFALCALFCCFTLTARAGQGPQNVAVVINARSPLSVEIGHRYAQLRHIPVANLVYLDWDGPPIGTNVETFRQRILLPIARVLDERKIATHVTTIAYSADFPYVIDFKEDLKEDSKIDPTAKQFPQGSLTGLTYMGALVAAKDVNYSNLGANFYYRPSLDDKLLLPTRSFDPGAIWNPQGDTTDTKGLRYLMSTMLAYTSGRGNSLAEVEKYLRDAVVADGTSPEGTIYFLTNGDVRAKTRQPHFKSVVNRLEDLGVAAEIVDGHLPRDRGDVLGAMLGCVDYRFSESGSRVRPGAICENLTSFGGILRENGGQTPLTECLRAGAAGSSGTVTEPYAIPAKFPHPMMHVHYAQGCSLVESFYQSVHGPYQLLVVGDPLCRPWATIPTIKVEGLPEDKRVADVLRLTPSASTVADKKISHYELYADAIRVGRCQAGESLEIDTTKWADGYHELRVVGYEDSPIATQGEWTAEVFSTNHRWKPIELEIERPKLSWNEEVTIRAHAPGAGAMVLYHNHRTVGVLNTDHGAWTLSASKLGAGPGHFKVIAARGQGPANSCLSRNMSLEITPPEPLAPASAASTSKPGLKLVREGKAPYILERLADDWPDKAGLAADEAFQIESVWDAGDQQRFQLQVEFAGELEVLVNGHSLASHTFASTGMLYVPLVLETGTHRLELRGKLNEARKFHAWFGHQGTQTVTNALFRHVE